MKVHICWYCGKDLRRECDSRDRETCGDAECEREARYAYQVEEAERAERAREDNYERY